MLIMCCLSLYRFFVIMIIWRGLKKIQTDSVENAKVLKHLCKIYIIIIVSNYKLSSLQITFSYKPVTCQARDKV